MADQAGLEVESLEMNVDEADNDNALEQPVVGEGDLGQEAEGPEAEGQQLDVEVNSNTDEGASKAYKRTFITLNHEKKREVLRHKQKNPSLTNLELAKWIFEKWQLVVSQSSVRRWLLDSTSLLTKNTGNNVKRLKIPKCPIVEEALYKWFVAAQEAKLPISDDLLTTKAIELHTLLSAKDSMPTCKFSSGWLTGFKKRHCIKIRVLNGEANPTVKKRQGIKIRVLEKEANCNVTIEDTWAAIAALKTILADYEEKDIFNLDETGLFYNLGPNRTLRDLAVSGQKEDKTRLTLGLCANVDGSVKLPPIVINKARSPRAFTQRRIKRPNNLGMSWYYNKNAWMNGTIFQDWVTSFEAHMKALGRKKVVLLVDSCPGHVIGTLKEKLQITTIHFFPPNTASRFQPMDAGITQSFKMQYRRLLIGKQLAALESGQHFVFDVFDAVNTLIRAWNDGVTPATIRNCCGHTHILPNRDEGPTMRPLDIDLDAPLVDADSQEQIKQLTELLGQLALKYDVNMEWDEYVDADSRQNAPTFSLDDEMSSFLPDLGEQETEEDTIEEPDGGNGADESDELVPIMTYGLGMGCFETLRLFFQQQSYNTESMIADLNKIQSQCTKAHLGGLV